MWFKRVMANLHSKLGLDKSKKKPAKKTSTLPKEEAVLKLTKSELEALAIGLGEATFQGKHVEAVYKLAIKIQVELEKFK